MKHDRESLVSFANYLNSSEPVDSTFIRTDAHRHIEPGGFERKIIEHMTLGTPGEYLDLRSCIVEYRVNNIGAAELDKESGRDYFDRQSKIRHLEETRRAQPLSYTEARSAFEKAEVVSEQAEK